MKHLLPCAKLLGVEKIIELTDDGSQAMLRIVDIQSGIIERAAIADISYYKSKKQEKDGDSDDYSPKKIAKRLISKLLPKKIRR